MPGNAGDDAKYASNPADFDADQAAGDNDVRHRVVLQRVVGLRLTGQRRDRRWCKALLDGWSLSWIASVQSGLPYSERRHQRPQPRRQPRATTSCPAAATPTGCRNRLQRRHAAVAPHPASASKLGLELIAEAFNLLNTTNITSQQNVFYNFTGGVLVPQANLSNPRLNFGADRATQINFGDTQRIVQIAAKFTF